MIGLKDGAAQLEEHSTEWQCIAKETIGNLKEVFGEAAVDIQHVGSTSIIGLMAKPIIDIAVGVKSIQEVIDLIPALEKKGFLYRPRTAREGHILFACRDFSKRMDTHYIHVVIYGDAEWNNYIKFRDVLNENPDTLKKYQDLKLQLSKEFPEDREKYANIKAPFILSVLNGGCI